MNFTIVYSKAFITDNIKLPLFVLLGGHLHRRDQPLSRSRRRRVGVYVGNRPGKLNIFSEEIALLKFPRGAFKTQAQIERLIEYTECRR